MTTPWRIEMFGGLRAVQGGRVITRFRTQKAALLLAYLALHAGQPQPREALLDLLWADEDLDAARNGLRVTLSSLRRQLEPPGTPPGSVLDADRLSVTLRRAACSTDFADFWDALRAGDERRTDAIALYGGEFLPGAYADWVLAERRRAAEAYRAALHQLTRTHTEAGRFEQAVDTAHRAVQADPFDEAAHRNLIHLHAAQDRPDAARRQYDDLVQTLRGIGAVPDDETRALIAGLKTGSPPRPAGRTNGKEAQRSAPQSSPSVPAAARAPSASDRLPVVWNRFFGRAEEGVALRVLLQPGTETRLLTLTGPGGNGKTRLAVETARGLLADYGGAVWFVPLADVTDGDHVGDAARDALGLPPDPHRDPWGQAAEALSGGPTLLLLDNFEQVAPVAGPRLLSLMRHCPALTCLVTSRRRLDVPGEREFPVAPLPVPDGGETPEGLTRNAAVRLFTDRAQAARPDFAVTARNAPDVAALCRDLEGIPLALELAAARARVMTPAQMRPLLRERFALLTAPRPGGPDRHRSLWAAMDWSFGLLPPPQRIVFARLSVFRGGWDLEAAEGVCGDPHALDTLTHLRTHSLVATAEDAAGLRFRLLDTLREFAGAQLPPPERAALAARHAEYFLALARQAQAGMAGPEQAGWLDRLEADHDNLRAALDWGASDGGDPATGLRLAVAAWRFWYSRGHLREGRERLTAALRLAPDTAETRRDRAAALSALGVMHWKLGDGAAARESMGAALCAFQELGDTAGEANVLNNRGLLAESEGDLDGARAAFERSLALKQARGDRAGLPSTLNNLGGLARATGQGAWAQGLFIQSLALCRELGDRAVEADVLNSLGNVRFDAGDPAGAREFYRESLAIKRGLGYRQGVAVSLSNLGGAAMQQEDWPAAQEFLAESLAIFRDMGVRQDVGSILSDMGRVKIAQGDCGTARAHLTESLTLVGTDGHPQDVCGALESFAALAAAENDWERAATLIGASSALREARQAPRVPPAEAEAERIKMTARAALGDYAFLAVWERGQALTPLGAVALALQT